VDDAIREIINKIEYSPEKYLILLEENRELKKQICIHTKETFPPLPTPSIIRKKNITRDNIDGKYHVEGNKFEKIRGTREEVWCGTAYQTTGELKKIDLELNKHGKIVSKIKLITATAINNFVNVGGDKHPPTTPSVKGGVIGEPSVPLQIKEKVREKRDKS
jgi:hypothetical protein